MKQVTSAHKTPTAHNGPRRFCQERIDKKVEEDIYTYIYNSAAGLSKTVDRGGSERRRDVVELSTKLVVTKLLYSLL